MKNKIKFYFSPGGFPKINVENAPLYFSNILSSICNIKIIDKILLDCSKVTSEYKEYVLSGQSFIRIWVDKIEFGQYDDNFFHEMEEFKDYVEEGEKIFGSIPTEDFIEIAQQWRDFIIQSEKK